MSASESKILTLHSELDEQKKSHSNTEGEMAELSRRLTNLQRDLKQSVQLGIECRIQYETELNEVQQKLDEALEANKQCNESITVERARMLTATKIETDVEEQSAGLQELQLKLHEQTTCNGQLNDQINTLKATIESMMHDKNELMTQLQVKTQDYANIQGEITRLTEIINTEMERNTNFVCQNCDLLMQKIGKLEHELKLSMNNEKVNDQMHFLREKADILTANLMTEQNNQKILQNEKIELLDKNQNLTKDLERLRQHLLEIEEAHTQETMELQARIDESNRRLADMEEQVKHSSTAYTSAKYVYLPIIIILLV